MKKLIVLFAAVIVSLSMVGCEKEVIEPNDCGEDYLVYSGLISQTGSEDPTVVFVGANTLGNIEWHTTFAGVYFGTLTGAFAADKTIISITENGTNSQTFRISRSSDDHIVIVAKDDGEFANGLLYKTPIEIMVLK